MNKAFIFDMDGVLVNSMPLWEKFENQFFTKNLGQTVYFKIKDELFGRGVNEIFKIAKKAGFKLNKKEYVRSFDQAAQEIYAKAKITSGLEELADLLLKKGFKLGLVSQSRKDWIKNVIPKLSFYKRLEYIVSVDDHQDLEAKPQPDGYLEAIKQLKATPQTSIILEDSNTGIKAAKASGAFTICLKEHLEADYQPKGADMYVEKLTDLTRLFKLLT